MIYVAERTGQLPELAFLLMVHILRLRKPQHLEFITKNLGGIIKEHYKEDNNFHILITSFLKILNDICLSYIIKG